MNMVEKKKIMVTGGAGFIGSALCRGAIEAGHEVLNLDKLTYAANLNSLEAIEASETYDFKQIDICNGEAVAEAIQSFQPDHIFNLAAETHVDRSIDVAAPFIDTNIVGTYKLLEVALNYFGGLSSVRQDSFRYIHVSTDEVFGSLGPTGKFSETTPYDPSSPYSASKAASDHLARAWQRTFDLPVIVTNCSNNYGPFQFPEKLIPLMILNAVEGQMLPVYGDGQNIRDWLYVEDHVAALLMIASTGRIGDTYTIGGDCEKTNLALIEMICDILDEKATRLNRPRRELISFVADRPGHDLRYAVDTSKLTNELGWRPRMSFEEGLGTTIKWYLDNPDWWRPLRDKTYDGTRLGLKK